MPRLELGHRPAPTDGGAAGLLATSTSTVSAEVCRMGYGPVIFTLADALAMVRHQIIPEDSTIELLNGRLVYRDRFELCDGQVVLDGCHCYVTSLLADVWSAQRRVQSHLRTQAELVCSATHVPIADGIVLRGQLEDYRDLPTAADAYCVIEVADSSYERDAGEKLEGYARAGIRQYVIINLRNHTAEVYTDPDVTKGTYAPPVVLTGDEILRLRVGEVEELEVPLAELLPSREQ